MISSIQSISGLGQVTGQSCNSEIQTSKNPASETVDHGTLTEIKQTNRVEGNQTSKISHHPSCLPHNLIFPVHDNIFFLKNHPANFLKKLF
jgi:hypothetical protein